MNPSPQLEDCKFCLGDFCYPEGLSQGMILTIWPFSEAEGNIKNKDQKCFLWCHVRHINPSKEHPERITKEDINLLSILLVQKKLHQKIKSLLVILIMLEFSFPCKKKVLVKLRWKAIFVSMCLVTKMDWFFRFSLQIKNLKIQWICCF